MRKISALALVLTAVTASADEIPFLRDEALSALASELSGTNAKKTIAELSRHHRMRASEGFSAATAHIVAELKRAGLEDVRIERIPSDGRIFYGTQRSRPAWNVREAELWEIGAEGQRITAIANYADAPITLAQDSASADVRAELVDAGSGTSLSEYEGKDVRGKIVLVSSQPEAVVPLAVGRFGAAGIVSYAPNQRSAWWQENGDLVRWGHLDAFSPTRSFGFMISLNRARAFQERLRRGETILLHARVDSTTSAGEYEVATGTIRGVDPALRQQEIVFSCHLDHPNPGANDNASGCAAILEIARTYSALIASNRLQPPRRTIRFIWPAEIEGTLALLVARPEMTRNFKAAIHLDMVGGGPETKAVFHVTRGPASLPSFINDVAEEIGAFVNEQTEAFAKTGSARWPLVEKDGGKEPLAARFVPLTIGSDHQIFAEGSFGIPVIYLNDWPDRYIHTSHDVVANIDSTKLKRSAFIAAAGGWVLANITEADARPLWDTVRSRSLARTATVLREKRSLIPQEAANLARFHFWYERTLAESMSRFFPIPQEVNLEIWPFYDELATLTGRSSATRPASPGRVYRRNASLRGPMTVFGYDYLVANLGREKTDALRLLRHQGRRGSGAEYAYEALNLVNGRRTTGEIRDALAAIYGPVTAADVEQYLDALATIRVVEMVVRSQ